MDPRRDDARHWVERIRSESDRQITLDEKPAGLDEEHWSDLCAGTRFFAARAAAFDVLNNKSPRLLASRCRWSNRCAAGDTSAPLENWD
jgi:hypothetical protein